MIYTKSHHLQPYACSSRLFLCHVKWVWHNNLPVKFHHWTVLCDDIDGKTWIICNNDNCACNFSKVLKFSISMHKINRSAKCLHWHPLLFFLTSMFNRTGRLNQVMRVVIHCLAKCPFGVILSTKIATKLLSGFLSYDINLDNNYSAILVEIMSS